MCKRNERRVVLVATEINLKRFLQLEHGLTLLFVERFNLFVQLSSMENCGSITGIIKGKQYSRQVEPKRKINFRLGD